MRSEGWCSLSADQATCYQHHVLSKLRPGPGRGRNRECPTCGGNLSINPGDRGMWLVWNCQSGCDPRIVRLALEQTAGIPARCLGSYASDEWERRQQQHSTATYARPDTATLAAARKFHACAQLIHADVTNASLLRMCLQAISESEGSIPGDPALLLPSDYREFNALAKRTGIERCHAAKLARQWLKREGPEQSEVRPVCAQAPTTVGTSREAASLSINAGQGVAQVCPFGHKGERMDTAKSARTCVQMDTAEEWPAGSMGAEVNDERMSA